ncbi:MAG: hypothetical protein QM503_04635 [Bacteroidota bacterium]
MNTENIIFEFNRSELKELLRVLTIVTPDLHLNKEQSLMAKHLVHSIYSRIVNRLLSPATKKKTRFSIKPAEGVALNLVLLVVPAYAIDVYSETLIDKITSIIQQKLS